MVNNDKPRSLRVKASTWDRSLDRLGAIEEPVTVSITVPPGWTRTKVIVTFLEALIDATRQD